MKTKEFRKWLGTKYFDWTEDDKEFITPSFKILKKGHAFFIIGGVDHGYFTTDFMQTILDYLNTPVEER